MTDIKWTPGPWDQMVKMNGFTAVGANTLIARVFSTAFLDQENEQTNAYLIAAAPDLYAAASAIVSASELHGADGPEFFEARNAVLSALAKARGESV